MGHATPTMHDASRSPPCLLSRVSVFRLLTRRDLTAGIHPAPHEWLAMSGSCRVPSEAHSARAPVPFGCARRTRFASTRWSATFCRRRFGGPASMLTWKTRAWSGRVKAFRSRAQGHVEARVRRSFACVHPATGFADLAPAGRTRVTVSRPHRSRGPCTPAFPGALFASPTDPSDTMLDPLVPLAEDSASRFLRGRGVPSETSSPKRQVPLAGPRGCLFGKGSVSMAASIRSDP